MKSLCKWLQQQPREAESKALDYLNSKGFYCNNKKLSIAEQIEHIESRNARDLHFIDCVRKLKNNIRQQKSAMRTPGIKPRTFKISNSSYEALKAMAEIQNATIHSVLETIISNESAKYGIRGSFTGYAQNDSPGYDHSVDSISYNYPTESPHYFSAHYSVPQSNIGEVLAGYLEGKYPTSHNGNTEFTSLGPKLQAMKDRIDSNKGEN